MKQRKPHQYRPTIVTPQDGREFVEQFVDEDASNALALENFYQQDEWFRHCMAEAREACQQAQGVDVPFV